MSSAKNFDLSALIPGFDAFKKMAGQIPGVGKGLGAGAKNPFMPNPGSWIAPTLSVDELEKRITELQTVKLWLENNARLIEATIQALQVQKMTVATLQEMKINLGKVWPGMAAASADAASAARGKSGNKAKASRNKTEFDMGQGKEAAQAQPATAKPTANQASDKADPNAAMQMASGQALQMWQGLTQQFGQIASQVMQESQAAAQKMAQATPQRKRAAAKKTTNRVTAKSTTKTASQAAAKAPAKATRKAAVKSPRKAASKTVRSTRNK